MRGTHLGQNFIQPLQRTVQVDLYPARCRGDILTMVFGTPSFNETSADGAHFGKFVNGFKSVIDSLSKEMSKFLVVENLEAATGWYLAHGGGVKAVRVIAVPTLYEDGAVA